jgi:hypothetical protein
MCMRFVTVLFAYAGEYIGGQSDSRSYELGGDLLFGIEYFDDEVNLEPCVVVATKLSLLPMSLLVSTDTTRAKTLMTTNKDGKLNIEI